MSNRQIYDALIVGGGVIGAFVSRELSRYKVSVLVIEKQRDVGEGTSSANSAIVHSGYDPKPGTKKALFNVAGAAMYPQICKDLDVSFKAIGSLTLAFGKQDEDVLKELQERGKLNGVETRILDQEELQKAEPNVSKEATAALFAPAAIINPFTLVAHAFENAIENGVELHTSEEVVSICEKEGGYLVKTNKGEYACKVLINCAGVHSADIASLLYEHDWKILPRKGQYYVLDHFDPSFIKHVLFPLPSQKGKGILVVPTTAYNYLLGPSSEFEDDLDDKSTDPITLKMIKEGALKMAPKLPLDQIIRVFAGVRATPSTHDFIIEEAPGHKGFINCAGIESPGLASAPAIARHVVEQLVALNLNLVQKDDFNPRVRPYIKPLTLKPEERDALIARNPAYGKIVCGCEKITLGEVKDLLSRAVPTNGYRMLKLRIRAGFGKCGGSFCEPNIRVILKGNSLKDDGSTELKGFYEELD